MEDDKKKYELGSIVTAKRTYNGKIITGAFGGFYLLDKSNPKSMVGVVHTPNGSYDVEPNSIESVISEDEEIRKWLLKGIKYISKESLFFDIVSKDKVIAWLEKQGEILENIKYKEAMLDCQTCANYKNECFPDRNIFKCSYPIKYSEKNPQDIDENQGERKQNVTDIDIISDLENYFATTTKEQQEKDWEEIENWEEKHFNHNWKPSDEQIESFEHFVRSVGESGYASPYSNNTRLLYSLLEQLKKLREK